jgi:hypothetical protein
MSRNPGIIPGALTNFRAGREGRARVPVGRRRTHAAVADNSGVEKPVTASEIIKIANENKEGSDTLRFPSFRA